MKVYVWVQLNRQSTWNLCFQRLSGILWTWIWISFHSTRSSPIHLSKGNENTVSTLVFICFYLISFILPFWLLWKNQQEPTNYLPYSKLDCENKNSSQPYNIHQVIFSTSPFIILFKYVAFWFSYLIRMVHSTCSFTFFEKTQVYGIQPSWPTLHTPRLRQTLSRCGNSDPDTTHRKPQPWRDFGSSKKHHFLASTGQLCRSKRYSSSYYDVQIPSWVGYCVPCTTDVELGWMKCKISSMSGRRWDLPGLSFCHGLRKPPLPQVGHVCVSTGRGFVAWRQVRHWENCKCLPQWCIELRWRWNKMKSEIQDPNRF